MQTQSALKVHSLFSIPVLICLSDRDAVDLQFRSCSREGDLQYAIGYLGPTLATGELGQGSGRAKEQSE